MPFQADIYQLADELKAVASMGLHFADEPHVEERYNRVLAASARLVGMLEQRPAENVLDQYAGVPGRWGPLLTSSAAVFRDDRLVLVKRRDTGLWCLPRDIVRASELVAECAQRSLGDQTGMTGQVAGLLGVFDSCAWRYPAKSQFYQAVFHVESNSTGSLESSEDDVRLVSADEVSMLSPGVDPVVPTVFDLYRGEAVRPYFDLGDRKSKPVAGETVGTLPSQKLDYLSDMREISRELDEIGTNGVEAPEHPYATERYRHVLSASARLAEAVKDWSPGDVLVRYEDNISYEGLHLGAFAAAFRDGQILLIRREDTGRWSMPAGGTDVGETWANCAVRELEEETSVGGRVVELLALFDFRVLRDPPRPLVMAAFLVQPDRDAEPRAMPETLGAGYFPVNALPEMSPRSTVSIAIDLYEGRVPRPHFDLPTIEQQIRHGP